MRRNAILGCESGPFAKRQTAFSHGGKEKEYA